MFEWPVFMAYRKGAQELLLGGWRSYEEAWVASRSSGRHLHAPYSPLSFSRTVLMGPGSRQMGVESGVLGERVGARSRPGAENEVDRLACECTKRHPTGRAAKGAARGPMEYANAAEDFHGYGLLDATRCYSSDVRLRLAYDFAPPHGQE